MHSMQAVLSGPVTSSSSSIAKAPGGSPGPQKPGKDGDEFGPNFGEAVVVLREDLPLLFQQEMRFHIYRDDITFRTPSLRYLSGLWKYRLLARGARWLGRLLYSDLSLNVPRMWQPPGNRRQLRVRWTVSGVARLPMLGGEQSLSTEVISTYTFDSQGKIYEHQVDQIIPPESPLVKLLEWLMERLQPGAVLQPQLPIPGMPRG
ncbi:hypothetical protein COO60DRAFT_1705574 [Scenedesmus sp. NREL 46B-D3]|nr:hypothetical protein COO60DRAFT_1705574 [Scenedesmus sp. NREL 46B-D3]